MRLISQVLAARKVVTESLDKEWELIDSSEERIVDDAYIKKGQRGCASQLALAFPLLNWSVPALTSAHVCGAVGTVQRAVDGVSRRHAQRTRAEGNFNATFLSPSLLCSVFFQVLEGKQLAGFFAQLFGAAPATFDNKWVRIHGKASPLRIIRLG